MKNTLILAVMIAAIASTSVAQEMGGAGAPSIPGIGGDTVGIGDTGFGVPEIGDEGVSLVGDPIPEAPVATKAEKESRDRDHAVAGGSGQTGSASTTSVMMALKAFWNALLGVK